MKARSPLQPLVSAAFLVLVACLLVPVGAENVPAMADALPGFDVAPRLMLLAPTGTPAPIVRKLNEAVRTVLASADLAQAAALQGAIPSYMAPEQLGPEMQRESVEWGKVIKTQKISAD